MTPNDPRQVWADLLSSGPDLQRRFENHPLRLHFGTDHLLRPVLLLRVDSKPESVRLGDAVSVEIGERPAQHEWALVLTLKDKNLTQTFIDLSIDLAERSSSGCSEQQALMIFRKALEEFRDLLSRANGAAMSLEELRGLVAELWFALRVVAPRSSPTEALTAWEGPLGAAQDFRFPDGSLAEVKSIHEQVRSVKISSPEQLDPTEPAALQLVTLALEECAPRTEGAVSLSLLVEEFRSSLKHDADQLDELDRRLRALGVSRTYMTLDRTFTVTAMHRYAVTDQFPRIRRDAVSLGIQRLRYEIELRAIRQFEIPVPFENTGVSP